MNNARGEPAFSRLEKASITLSYLRSNSTTHENPFSAIAELCDNAYDADASNLHIDFMEKDGEETLRFLDDGTGMSHQEAVSVISFGHSVKNCHKIGRYGNGLKSGGFHLGTELLMLTKKDGIQTALFISHRFHEEKGLSNAVFVPCPAFKLDMEPVFSDEGSRDRFDQEMDIIEAYAPLGGRALQELFDEITGDSGTHIIISGLKRSVVGGLSIILNDRRDIKLEGDNLMPYQQSLRSYLEILYLKPKMRILLRGEQVFPKKLIEYWIGRQKFALRTEHFSAAYKVDHAAIVAEIAALNKEKKELESAMGTMNQERTDITHESRKKRFLTLAKLEDIHKRTIEAEKKKKDKELSRRHENNMFYMYFGIQTKDRSDNGIHFYINNRLIIWGYKAKSTFFKSQPKEHTIGISSYVNLNYDVFHPTHNKQGFSNARDFNTLVRNCDERLKQYSDYIEKNWAVWHLQQHWKRDVVIGENVWELLWNAYGYRNAFSLNCQQAESDENRQRILEKECGVWRVCQICRNWRRLNSLKDIDGEDAAPEFFKCRNILAEKDLKECPVVNFERDERFVIHVENYATIALSRALPPPRAAPSSAVNAPSTSSQSTSGPSTSNQNRQMIKTERTSFSPVRNIKRESVEDPPELLTEVERIVRKPAPSVNLPRIESPERAASPVRTDPSLSPPSNRRTATPSTNGRRAVMHNSDDESEQGSSAQRPRREVARKPVEKIGRRRERRDQEDDDEDFIEQVPIAKKKLKVKTPTKASGGAGPSGLWSPSMSKDDQIAALKRERLTAMSTIRRLEDGKEQYDHKLECVFDALKKKFGLKVPATGTSFDKLSAVYEDIVPRSVRNAKK